MELALKSASIFSAATASDAMVGGGNAAAEIEAPDPTWAEDGTAPSGLEPVFFAALFGRVADTVFVLRRLGGRKLS